MQDGCQPEIPLFTGRLGIYIEGSVSPPLSGVYIRVIAKEDSHSSTVKQGDLVLETTSGVDGHYVVGPLYDDTKYETEASKVCEFYIKNILQIAHRENETMLPNNGTF